MRTGQNCQGECREVLGKLTYLRKSFVEGFSRCKICEYWLDWRFCHLRSGEKANSESRGMYCNCCNYQVRQRPHSREAKETLERHNEQSTSSKEDNYNKPKLRSEELEIKAKQDFQYTWIGLMSGSGFSWEAIEYNKSFNEPGIGFGLVDAVTKKLFVNKETNEGKKLNQMFLSECITS